MLYGTLLDMSNDSQVLETEELESDDEPWIAEPEDLPDEVPARFILVAYDEEGNPGVFMWGMQLPGSTAVVVSPDGRNVSKTRSAEAAHRLFSIAHEDLELLWIDPPLASRT